MKPLYVKKNGTVNKVSGIAMPNTFPANRVGYDNTASELEATNTQDAIDEVVDIVADKAGKPSSSTSGNLAGLDANGNLTDAGWASDKTTSNASGNPISISGLKSNQLAINPIITLEPIQAGSGDPSPSNVRAISGYNKIEVLSCQKNILKATLDSLKQNNTSIQGASWSGNACTVGNVVFTVLLDNNGDISGIKVTGSAPSSGYTTFKLTFPTYQTLDKYGYEVGKTYTLSGCPSGGGTLSNYNLIWNSGNSSNIVDYGNGVNFSVNTTNTYYLEIRIISGYTIPSGGLIFYPMIEEGTAKTSFVPYHKTTDLSESLGQTVYGATLDVRTGKLTVTHGKKDMGDLGWNIAANNVFYSETDIGAAKKDGITCVCSCYNAVANISGIGAMTTDKDIALMNSTTNLNRVYVKDTSYSTVSDFKTAVTGQKLVYELATPFTIQLTPHEIALSQGYNYISTNGSQIQLSYHNGEIATHADVEQLGETVNEILSNQTAIFSPSQNVSSVSEKHFFKVGNLVNISCCVTGTFNNGAYTDIGTIAYRPLNIMWFPLINRVTGTLAGVIRLTTDGIISVLPSANLTNAYINLMFIANKQ